MKVAPTTASFIPTLNRHRLFDERRDVGERVLRKRTGRARALELTMRDTGGDLNGLAWRTTWSSDKSPWSLLKPSHTPT